MNSFAFVNKSKLSNGILKLTIVFGVLMYVLNAFELDEVQNTTNPVEKTTYASHYHIHRNDGQTCILIETIGMFNITYRTASDEDATVSIPLPNDVDRIFGDCSIENWASLSLKFSGFTLDMKFKKTTDSEEWYINTIHLIYSTSNPVFKQSDHPNNMHVILSSDYNTILFLTPLRSYELHGDVYVCNDCNIILYTRDVHDRAQHKAILSLRQFRFSFLELLHEHKPIPYTHIVGALAAVAFVMFCIVCLFFVHEQKVTSENI
ncbi:uncharacterized protein LOC116352405 [Contarinia nasturtii]|uniref:uncharacterized protein LOC116352405 n=1 Tax=Contarinia nasturtii TaxID=265458 RepID=UPI0012D4BCD9|nr:uncharacterized protein LOC116352405 [Contarinia nasturtii]XP_031640833.1 uncharacterized protein LOC116352405 [Contarinia nasturtii]